MKHAGLCCRSTWKSSQSQRLPEILRNSFTVTSGTGGFAAISHCCPLQLTTAVSLDLLP